MLGLAADTSISVP